MSPFFEDAAHLLRLLTASGLTVSRSSDCRAIIMRIADVLDDVAVCDTRVSHADAARFILGELELHKLAACTPDRRSKVLAIIGTSVGNVDVMRECRRRRQR